MSTIFAIFAKPPKTDGHGQLTEEDFNIPYTEIARRSSSIIFLESVNPIIVHLPDDVEVFPLDNTPQGIYTVGDIRKKVKELD